MKEKKTTFLLFLEQKDNFQDYSDAELGQIFRAVYEYADSGIMQDFQDRAMKVLFRSICRQIDLSNKKYEEVRQIRSEQGKKGGAPKGNQNASKKKSKSETTQNNQNNQNNLTDTDTDTLTDTDTVTLSVPSGEQTNRQTISQTLSFQMILFKMKSGFAYEEIETEQDLSAYDADDREVQDCEIPYEFLEYDTLTMQNALKFLTGFSNLQDGEFKNFADTVILCLSEAVFSPETQNPHAMIDRFNLINQSISFGQWLEGFAFKYSKILETQGSDIYNKYGYLKKCAVNYLKEYQASEILPGFKNPKNKYDYFPDE